MLVVFSSMDRAKVLVWNVRELNSPTRRGAVRAIVKDHGTSVISGVLLCGVGHFLFSLVDGTRGVV